MPLMPMIPRAPIAMPQPQQPTFGALPSPIGAPTGLPQDDRLMALRALLAQYLSQQPGQADQGRQRVRMPQRPNY